MGGILCSFSCYFFRNIEGMKSCMDITKSKMNEIIFIYIFARAKLKQNSFSAKRMSKIQTNM